MDSGRETVYDPSRHGPMTEPPRQGSSANRLVQAAPESRLDQLNKRLYDFQDRLSGHRHNLHALADRLGGVTPEVSANGGRKEVPRPEPNGIVQALEGRLMEIYELLDECGHEMDRLRQL